jgi:MFS family permease
MELVSAVGSGLVLPFTSIYLYEVRGLQPAAIGAVLAGMAVVGLAGALLSGKLESRAAPRHVAQVGLCLQGLGFLLIAVSSGIPAMAFAFGIAGLGTGLANPMMGVILSKLAPKAAHAQAFGTSHWMLNLGLGIGAVVGGTALADLSPSRFHLLFALNGATFLLLALGLLWFPTFAGTPEDEKDSNGSTVSYLSVIAQPIILLILVAQLASEALGFAQLDTSVTLMLSNLVFSTTAIGFLIAANTVTVVVLQIPLSRWTTGLPRHRLLFWQSVLWAAGYVLGWVATSRHASWSFAVLAVFFVLFAVGECLYSSALMPLVNESVGSVGLGRAFALLTVVSGLSKLGGPTLGLVVIGTGSPRLLWLLMAAGAVVTILCSLKIAQLAQGTPAEPKVKVEVP